MNIGITLTSSMEVGQEYIDLTENVAKVLAQKGHGIVYGGTSYGMMRRLAEVYKENQGNSLTGVMAQDLIDATKNYEKFEGLDREYTMKTMEERKRKIIELSDAYIILPGGYGTFEEIASIVGGQANKLFSKPIAFYNYKNYYDSLFHFLKEMFELRFSKVDPDRLYFASDNLSDILVFFERYSREDLPDKFVV